MIVVMGATGRTGRKIAARLLAAGCRVRALGRSESKLAALERAGAEVLTGDAADAAFLARAFHGAAAVYTLLPTDPRSADYRARQRREGEAIAQALGESGVRRVVALSSLGAELAAGTGLIVGLHDQEQRLQRLAGVDLLLLRPVTFFESFRDALGPIARHGVHADAVAPDLPLPMVATRDIAAAAAAAALAVPDWRGVVVRELLGPRDLSYREATRLLGQRLSLPDLASVQLPPAAMTDALVGAGCSASFARLYLEMTRAFGDGTIRPLAGRTAENTTPTRFEDVVDELVGDDRAA